MIRIPESRGTINNIKRIKIKTDRVMKEKKIF
jgi:hypothetical protein